MLVSQTLLVFLQISTIESSQLLEFLGNIDLICCRDGFSELCLVFLESFSCEQNAKLGLKGQTFLKMIGSLSVRTIRCPKVSIL